MVRYVRARLISAVPVLLAVSVLVFSMLYFVPGDPVQAMLGEQANVDRATLDRIRQELGLNDHPVVQYVRYLAGVLRGDLGRSFRTQRSVTETILDQLPSTLQLTFAAMSVAVLLGVSLGVAAALSRGRWLDNLTMVVALLGVSLPGFWLGMLLILLFSLALGWFPVSGTQGLERLVLPSLALGYGAAAVIARLVRSSLLEVLNQEYITTARAKGLSKRAVITRHALRNALIPVMTVVGLQIGNLLAGAVVIETVFSRQGVGRLLVQSILTKDIPLVQGVVMLIAAAYVLVNLLVDVLYAVVDPRIRLGGEST